MEQTTAMRNHLTNAPGTTQMRIGNTVFLVSAHFDKNSRESADAKMGRVLKQKSREKQIPLP